MERTTRRLSIFAVAALVATLFAVAGAPPASATTLSPTQEVPGTSELRDVACPTATACVAVGLLGGSGPVVVTITNGVAGAVQVLSNPAGGALDGVACPTATTCLAVGHQFVRVGNRPQQQGVLVIITDGVAGEMQVIPGVNTLRDVACPTATSCYAVGDSPTLGPVVVPITDGVPGTPQEISGMDNVSGIGCASATTCYLVGMIEGNFESENPDDWDSKAIVVPLLDGVVGPPQVIPGASWAIAVACSSATTCYATATGGFDFFLQPVVVSIFDGVFGEPQVVERVGALTAIACMSATTCEAVGFGDGSSVVGGVVVPIVNGVPGEPMVADGTNGLSGVGCASAATCVAVGLTFSFPYKGVVVVVDEAPTEATACKGVGWRLFSTPAFKNQGQCIAYVQAGPKSSR